MAAVTLVAWAAIACGRSPSSATAGTPSADAYVAVVRSFWADLHAADVGADGSDIDAKACLGELSPRSPSDVTVVEPSVCRAYAAASLTADYKFLAELGGITVPVEFARDDQVFRSHIPTAIADLTTLIAACDASEPQSIIDAMWAYADEMIPSVTNALDHVDRSVVHFDPSSTG